METNTNTSPAVPFYAVPQVPELNRQRKFSFLVDAALTIAADEEGILYHAAGHGDLFVTQNRHLLVLREGASWTHIPAGGVQSGPAFVKGWASPVTDARAQRLQTMLRVAPDRNPELISVYIPEWLTHLKRGVCRVYLSRAAGSSDWTFRVDRPDAGETTLCLDLFALRAFAGRSVRMVFETGPEAKMVWLLPHAHERMPDLAAKLENVARNFEWCFMLMLLVPVDLRKMPVAFWPTESPGRVFPTTAESPVD